jgi:adenylylsulfate kinase
MITLTSFISPYRRDRDLVRKLHEDVKLPFLEVYVDCPIDEAEKRDPKGLYKKARAGELKGFTGVDDPYEAPERPELVLRSDRLSVAESVAELLGMLERRGLI